MTLEQKLSHSEPSKKSVTSSFSSLLSERAKIDINKIEKAMRDKDKLYWDDRDLVDILSINSENLTEISYFMTLKSYLHSESIILSGGSIAPTKYFLGERQNEISQILYPITRF